MKMFYFTVSEDTAAGVNTLQGTDLSGATLTFERSGDVDGPFTSSSVVTLTGSVNGLRLSVDADDATVDNFPCHYQVKSGSEIILKGAISFTASREETPIPTTAADIGAIDVAARGAANGVAPLDSDGRVPSVNLGNTELGYAESRTTFGFSNNATWNDVTGLSIAVTAPGTPFYIEAEGLFQASHNAIVQVFLRIMDGATEIGRVNEIIIPSTVPSATAAARRLRVLARVTGIASGTLKTYRVQALQSSGGTAPLVVILGDGASGEKIQHHIRSWKS